MDQAPGESLVLPAQGRAFDVSPVSPKWGRPQPLSYPRWGGIRALGPRELARRAQANVCPEGVLRAYALVDPQCGGYMLLGVVGLRGVDEWKCM